MSERVELNLNCSVLCDTWSIVTPTYYFVCRISVCPYVCHRLLPKTLQGTCPSWKLSCPLPFAKAGDIKTHSSVRPSVRDKNFNLVHIFQNDRALIFGMHDPCDKPFQLTPCSDLDLWPTSRSKLLPGGGPQFFEFASVIYRLWLFSSRNTLLHNIHVVLLPICFLLKSNDVELHLVFDVDFIDKGAGLVHITIGFAMLKCRLLNLCKYIMVKNTFNGVD